MTRELTDSRTPEQKWADYEQQAVATDAAWQAYQQASAEAETAYQQYRAVVQRSDDAFAAWLSANGEEHRLLNAWAASVERAV